MPPLDPIMPVPVTTQPSGRPVVLAGRFRIERPLDDGTFEATDTSKGTTVVVRHVPFGTERAKERAQLIDRVRALWTVTAPALVLPVDAGAWDDDAFVVEEKVDAPVTSFREGSARLDAFERSSAARSVAEAIAALHAAGFVHGDLSLASIELDGYRQPKIHAAIVAVRASSESERVEDRKLRALLEEMAPGSVQTAREDATAAELVRSIAHVEPGPTPPFVPVAAGSWQGLTVLAIVLTLAAFVAIGWLLRQL